MKTQKYIVRNDCGSFVAGFNSTLEESIATRLESDFKIFNSKEEAQAFIDKCPYEDDFEIEEWNK